jgi:hypothetical protein
METPSIAPWAIGGGGHVAGGGQKQPPLTITGVAPWAIMKQPTQNSIPRPPRRSTGKSNGDQLPSMEESNMAEVIPEGEHESQNMNMSVKRTSLDEVRLYMAKLKPKEDSEESTDGISNWAKAQMNDSPVLLHNLKFHEYLVKS